MRAGALICSYAKVVGMVRSAFIISDIHLGASTSLLTAIDYDPDTGHSIQRPLAQEVLNRLCHDIRQATGGEKIQQCILLGDIFDLSFAPYGLTMQNGRWFFEQLIQADLFEEFIYIPGNHDHHLWQQICEHYYLMTSLENPSIEYPRTLPANFTLENTFLDQLLPEGYGFGITYPNYELQINGKHFYMHHGHFLQKLYIAASQFLSETIKTEDIEDLELLNSPFLEFGWYNLGQAYNIGKQRLLDRLYFMVKSHDTQKLDQLLHLFLKKIDKWGRQTPHPKKRFNPFGMLMDSMIQALGPFILKRLLLKQTRRFEKRQLASTARHKRLSGSLNTTVVNYISKYMCPPEQMAQETAFIFGHTHEPENDYVCCGPDGVEYHIYNTGGWIVDQLDDSEQFVLPQMAPILIMEDGTVSPILFTQNHEAFFREQLASDPVLQQIKIKQMMP
jgi:predicted phosphodiesterase